ncbi:DUF4145 domain-containing protein [Aeromonas salmonicida]|uniref:DUF4145 domain-containing protein n=1 Tax=Aeromonas salmonicida TaxID=645 RepID=UPI003D2423B9
MGNIIRIFCNTCKGETNHEIKSTHEKSYQEVIEDRGHMFLGYTEDTEYFFVVCRGCDSATLQEKWTCAGMYDQNGDTIYSYSYHPKRNNVDEREAKRFNHVDKKLNDSYKEIITAFQQGLEIVTAMGVRALLEGICVFEGIDDQAAWGLQNKINKLRDSPNIPNGIIDGLNGLKFIGDDAAHRLIATDKQTLSLSIDLLESLLTHLYETRIDLERKAELVKMTQKNKNQNSQ